ncbi:diaminopimelate decarboxylase [Granulicella sp. S190]|uniref:diaminopimelate decarboxylase n=1 Tax=Granulicella sp. S190 TaxID=1747226 RepID=UPI0020B1647B|nr:diaminopimelate decarboxylase [Granulicella sp. S190]
MAKVLINKIVAPRTALQASPRPFVYRDRLLHCDGVDLDTLATEYGTPLYVYSAEQISHRLQLFEEAFANRPHTLCYAVKANSSLAILRLLAKQGAGFDIVSGGELERVRRAYKLALGRVVFSGVGKQVWEIDAALTAGILLFNVESEAELHLLAERAESLGKVARFALRVNPDVFAETHPYISTGLSEHKFGIDIKAARSIYRKASKLKWLDAAGVSVHIGSQIRKVEPFAAAVARVTSLIAELRRDGHDIRYIDAGGGLGIDYGATAFDPAKQVVKYAAALTKGLGSETAHLLLEPGRFIVAQAGALLTRVLYVKKNDTKTFVITDAGMNDLIRPALYHAHHEIIPVKQASGKATLTADVVGPVCESGDFFARDRVLASVKPGDLVVLLDAGAYGMSQSSNYNSRTRPAEVLVDGDEVRLIRRRETMRDLLGPEVL